MPYVKRSIRLLVSFYFRQVVAIALAVALAAVLSPQSQKAQAASTQTPWRNLTPSKLTAVWWQWALGVPTPRSPLLDETGANAYSDQPYSDLVFLGGTFIVTGLPTGDVIGSEDRDISVRQNAALFFPLINTEYDNIGCTPHLAAPGIGCLFAHVAGFAQLQVAATAAMDAASLLFATWTPTNSNFQPIGAPT